GVEPRDAHHRLVRTREERIGPPRRSLGAALVEEDLVLLARDGRAAETERRDLDQVRRALVRPAVLASHQETPSRHEERLGRRDGSRIGPLKSGYTHD